MTDNIHPTIQHLAVPVAELKPYPTNPRRGDVTLIADSLTINGQYRPIVVNQRTHEVLAGNHTLKAAQQLGWHTIAATYVDADEQQAARIVAIDNRANDLAGYDNTQLVALLTDLPDLAGTGYTADDLDLLLASLQPTELPPAGPPLTDPDHTPEPPRDPITKPGDIWHLGPHRIICGDTRDYDTVTKLLAGARINVAFTSPPYASQRKYDETSGFQPIRPDEYVDWFEDVQANIRALLADDGSWFVNIKEHAQDGQRHLYVKDLTIAHVRRWGWLFVDELAWVHSGLPGTWDNRHKNQFEPIFHFSAGRQIKFTPLANGTPSNDTFTYTGDLKAASTGNPISWSGSSVEAKAGIALPGNVLHIGKSREAIQHEAMFPVALPAWFIRAYSDEGDLVFDPFMGSGTTLIAAHQENRIAYGTEISPGYCDVICRRYQEHTGVLPTLAATGEPHDFTANASESQP